MIDPGDVQLPGGETLLSYQDRLSFLNECLRFLALPQMEGHNGTYHLAQADRRIGIEPTREMLGFA